MEILHSLTNACDENFYGSMRAACEKQYLRSVGGLLGTAVTGGQALNNCYRAATAYYTAVALAPKAANSYQAAQAHARQEQNQQINASRDLFGSISLAPNGSWGSSWNASTREEADRIALQNCNRYSTGCEIKVWFKNTCGALARSQDGATGWGSNTSIEAARSRALSECSKYSSSCTLVTSNCSNSR